MKFKKGDIIHDPTSGYFRKILTIIDEFVYVVSAVWEAADSPPHRKEKQDSCSGLYSEQDLQHYSLCERKKEEWVPNERQIYYIPDVTFAELYDTRAWAKDNGSSEMYLKRNMVFKTKEEAIARAEEMIQAKVMI